MTTFMGGPIDIALWSLAIALTSLALWLARPRPPDWEMDTFFAAVWAARRRPSPLPLREGPVPAEGWDGDPADLGEPFDPARRVGPACTWEAVAAWTPAAQAAVARRLDDVRVVWLEPPALALPGVDPSVLVDPEGVMPALERLCAAPDVRLVFFARNAPGAVLRLLHAWPGVRDRTALVWFFGADLDAEREWLVENFAHLAFDVELARRLPFLTLRLERAGRAEGADAGEGGMQVLRAPDPADREVIQVVDLGVAPRDVASDPTLEQAIVVTLAAVAAGW